MIRILILLIVILTACTGEKDPVVCPDATCADFVSQQEAQNAFNANKDCLQQLDDDSDGIACEHLLDGGGSGGCPTTSNCGCSNKNKSECESSACCRWIVGTGCKCK